MHARERDRAREPRDDDEDVDAGAPDHCARGHARAGAAATGLVDEYRRRGGIGQCVRRRQRHFTVPSVVRRLPGVFVVSQPILSGSSITVGESSLTSRSHDRDRPTAKICYSGATGRSRRDREPLHRPVVDHLLLERDGNRPRPEGGRVRIRGHLSHLPLARESSEDVTRECGTDPAPPVLAHDEELRHVMRCAGSHEREACPFPVDAEEQRMAIGVGPVAIEISVPVQTVLVDIGVVERREVVLVQLEKISQYRLVRDRRLDHLEFHAPMFALAECAPHDVEHERRAVVRDVAFVGHADSLHHRA